MPTAQEYLQEARRLYDLAYDIEDGSQEARPDVDRTNAQAQTQALLAIAHALASIEAHVADLASATTPRPAETCPGGC